VSSTEFIQKDEAAEKNGEGNPEVEVGGDGMKEVAGRAVRRDGQDLPPPVALPNMKPHLRQGTIRSQRQGSKGFGKILVEAEMKPSVD
jgi:hypothetical protein